MRLFAVGCVSYFETSNFKMITHFTDLLKKVVEKCVKKKRRKSINKLNLPLNNHSEHVSKLQR